MTHERVWLHPVDSFPYSRKPDSFMKSDDGHSTKPSRSIGDGAGPVYEPCASQSTYRRCNFAIEVSWPKSIKRSELTRRRQPDWNWKLLKVSSWRTSGSASQAYARSARWA